MYYHTLLHTYIHTPLLWVLAQGRVGGELLLHSWQFFPQRWACTSITLLALASLFIPHSSMLSLYWSLQMGRRGTWPDNPALLLPLGSKFPIGTTSQTCLLIPWSYFLLGCRLSCCKWEPCPGPGCWEWQAAGQTLRFSVRWTTCLKV